MIKPMGWCQENVPLPLPEAFAPFLATPAKVLTRQLSLLLAAADDELELERTQARTPRAGPGVGLIVTPTSNCLEPKLSNASKLLKKLQSFFLNVGPRRASFCIFVSQGFTKQMTTTRYSQIRHFRILTRSLHLRVLLDNGRESLVGFTTVWLVLQPWECHQCREFVDTMSWVCWSQVSSNGYEFMWHWRRKFTEQNTE